MSCEMMLSWGIKPDYKLNEVILHVIVYELATSTMNVVTYIDH